MVRGNGLADTGWGRCAMEFEGRLGGDDLEDAGLVDSAGALSALLRGVDGIQDVDLLHAGAVTCGRQVRRSVAPGSADLPATLAARLAAAIRSCRPETEGRTAMVDLRGVLSRARSPDSLPAVRDFLVAAQQVAGTTRRRPTGATRCSTSCCPTGSATAAKTAASC